MKKTFFLSMTAALMMASQALSQSSYTITIHPNTSYQTIVDFGASDCWTGVFVGK